MKPAAFAYFMTVGTATLLAAILICRDLDVPILWSTAIGVTVWAWVVLMLWSTAAGVRAANHGPDDARAVERRRGTRRS